MLAGKMKGLLLLLFTTGLLSVCEAQSVRRQSIGTIGTTYHGDQLTIQQSVGQAYQTQAYYKGNAEVLPGFIQPSGYALSFVSPIVDIQIGLYPNPATDVVSFITDKNLEDLTIEVFNRTGKLIYREMINSLAYYKLNCSQWASGFYLLHLKDKPGNMYRAKLIKTN